MRRNEKSSIIEAAGGLLWRERDGKKEIAVIHRHHYDDWSLPKGKRTGDEDWKSTALREVLEETGYTAQVKDFAGTLTYTIEGKPKVVLFWHMVAQDYQPQSMNGEVDKVLWLPEEEAIKKINYPDERALISNQPENRVGGT